MSSTREPHPHRLPRMRLHHPRPQPAPAARSAARSSRRYASRDRAQGRGVLPAVSAASRSYGDYAAAIDDPARRRGRRRRAAALPPRPDAAGARRRQARARREAGVPDAWPTTRRCVDGARPRRRASCSSARTITTSRSPSALRRLLADGAIGEMVFAHFTTHRAPAEDGRRLAQRRDDGRRRRVLRGRHPLAAPRRQPRARRSRRSHGYRPAVSRDGPGSRAPRA